VQEMKKYFLMNDEECVFDSGDFETLQDAIDHFSVRHGWNFIINVFDESKRWDLQNEYIKVTLQ